MMLPGPLPASGPNVHRPEPGLEMLAALSADETAIMPLTRTWSGIGVEFTRHGLSCHSSATESGDSLSDCSPRADLAEPVAGSGGH